MLIWHSKKVVNKKVTEICTFCSHASKILFADNFFVTYFLNYINEFEISEKFKEK
jgi:hypothetical protein